MKINGLINNLLDTDSYKFSHWVQYPKNTTKMFSYLESRGGKYTHTVFFGLQYILQEYLSTPITSEDVDEAAAFAKAHGVPFNEAGWRRIVEVHKGRLPVRIRAVPEGSVVPVSNILMSVESTDPACFWVVSWLETMLVRLWYPITVATKSYFCKQTIQKFLDDTADDTNADFRLHDFGSRGVSSRESAAIGGAAHLVNFSGSDTVAGIYLANKVYDCEMAGFSIPATEHSTMTMWGRENEAEAYANLLEKYKDQPIFACVSDSYDIYNAARNIWGGVLRDKVERYNGTLVIRPDSGDPATVVVELLKILADRFGCTINSKGYKVIDHGVRVIQGDGINEDSMKEILIQVKAAGFSTENVTFGMGGGLLQQLNRDTCKFAFKCSYAEVNGQGVDVYKDPTTDKGKRSKRGMLELVRMPGGEVCTMRREDAPNTFLEDVYVDGKVLTRTNFEAVRARTKTPMTQYRGWLERSA